MTDGAKVTIWERVLAAGKWALHNLLGPLLVGLVILVGVVLAMVGVKDLQLGGIIGALLGKKTGPGDIDVANSIPKERIDSTGKLIPLGSADEQGMTQIAVVPIQPPGFLSNPDVVKFTPPGKSTPVEVKLPVGVKADHVEHVVVVAPGTFAVTVKDSSGITAARLDDLLKKYS
jgi:hypothetical protein